MLHPAVIRAWEEEEAKKPTAPKLPRDEQQLLAVQQEALQALASEHALMVRQLEEQKLSSARARWYHGTWRGDHPHVSSSHLTRAAHPKSAPLLLQQLLCRRAMSTR